MELLKFSLNWLVLFDSYNLSGIATNRVSFIYDVKSGKRQVSTNGIYCIIHEFYSNGRQLAFLDRIGGF